MEEEEEVRVPVEAGAGALESSTGMNDEATHSKFVTRFLKYHLSSLSLTYLLSSLAISLLYSLPVMGYCEPRNLAIIPRRHVCPFL